MVPPFDSNQVVEFTESVMAEREEEIGEHSYGGSNNKARKVLADMVESIAAAVYIDCNFDLELVWKVGKISFFSASSLSILSRRRRSSVRRSFG